jgi:lysozyme family protein
MHPLFFQQPLINYIFSEAQMAANLTHRYFPVFNQTVNACFRNPQVPGYFIGSHYSESSFAWGFHVHLFILFAFVLISNN